MLRCGVMLTVNQVAEAVSKSANYVRQHLHRGHLESETEAGQRMISVEALLRWAQARDLKVDPMLVAGLRSPSTEADAEPRAARVAVLAHVDGDRRINLATTIRHRRVDGLGPWAGVAPPKWRKQQPHPSLELWTIEVHDDSWEDMLHEMVRGVLDIEGRAVEYQLEPLPRRHLLVRDHTRGVGDGLASPFGQSADVVERWCLDDALRERWVALRDDVEPDALKRLGLKLHRFIDRVGNVLVLSAHDDVSCEIEAGRKGEVVLRVTPAAAFAPGSYRAVVWAHNWDDAVLRREVEVRPGETRIDVGVDVNRVGLALYRTSDGECVDYFDAYTIESVQVDMHLQGPQLRLQDRKGNEFHRVTPATHSALTVQPGDVARLTAGIRRLQLQRRADAIEQHARGSGAVVRVGPGRFADAVAQLRRYMMEGGSDEPIYLGDRYLMDKIKGGPAQLKGMLDILNAAGGRPLRILCTNARTAPAWWAQVPAQIRGRAEARCFLKNNTHAFHDRFLVTARREISISHSLTGWDSGGVTFIGMTAGVYRADVEFLWSLPIGTTGDYEVIDLK